MIRKILNILEEYFYSKSNEFWEAYYYYADYPKDTFGHACGQLDRDLAHFFQTLGDAIPPYQPKGDKR